MGILNVTPDSFSDGDRYMSTAAMAERIETLLKQGSDLIDVGGESTRPFAEAVSLEEELARVLPAIAAIRSRSEIPISIDTSKAEVARAALEAGASMVNDVTALRHDPAMIDVVRSHHGPVIIMHMRGTPGDMQVAPRYDDVISEIRGFFIERLAWMEEQGIDPERVVLDPGIGFGKTLEHNLSILRNVATFRELGRPVLIGHSRKSFLASLLALEVTERDPATAMLSALLARGPVDVLRVHDVALTRQALRLAEVMGK